MATITPTTAFDGTAQVVTWTDLTTTTDTAVAYATKGGMVRASVQFGGTFGGGTTALQGSEDGTNYVTLKDINGNAVSATSAARFEVTSAARYIKPIQTGGTGDNALVTVTLRGK